MTNYEKYIKGNDELLKRVVYRDYAIAVDKNGNLTNCHSLPCDCCQFCGSEKTCDESRRDWLSKPAGIAVGDIVVITDPGCQYEYYTDWVVEHVEDKKLAVSYRLQNELHKGDKYRVLAKAPHGSYASARMLYYIQSSDRTNDTCYLIGEEGIQPAE